MKVFEGDLDAVRRESSVDMDLDGTSEGPVNKVTDNCVDEQIDQRRHKRAKTIGAPKPMPNRNEPVTPRLSR